MDNKFEQHREKGSGCRPGGSFIYDRDGNLLDDKKKSVPVIQSQETKTKNKEED